MISSKAKILIVDDEEGFTKLTGTQNEIREENGFSRAFATAKDFQPDLDGVDVAAQVRNEPFLADVPIVSLTDIVTSREAFLNRQLGGYPLFRNRLQPTCWRNISSIIESAELAREPNTGSSYF